MSINYLNFKSGKKYKLIKVPDHTTVDLDGWPVLGAVGECKFTSSINGVAMDFGGETIIMPPECLEEYSEKSENVDPIPDNILVTLMLENPQGVLKILRGLWRMTKHPTIKDLMERSVLPIDNTNTTSTTIDLTNKTKEDFKGDWNQWEDYCKLTGDYCKLTGAMGSESGMIATD